MKKLLLSVIGYWLLVILVVPQPALAQFGTWSKCNTPNSVFGPAGAEVTTLQGFECIFQFILNIVVRLAGLAAFFMIIDGGFQYLTAGGNPEHTKKAAGTITWGIAGLAVLILIWFIMKFIKEFTGVDVTQFTIPGGP